MLGSVTFTATNPIWGYSYAQPVKMPIGKVPIDGSPMPDGSKFMGYRIRSIDGISPASANILMTDLSGLPGSVYSGSKLQPRTLTFFVDYVPYWSYGDTDHEVDYLRELLYIALRPGTEVRLKFEYDLDHSHDIRPKYITGYVESHETFTFQKDGNAQITILCPQPYFEGDPVETDGTAMSYASMPLASTVDVGVELEIPIYTDTAWLQVDNASTQNEDFSLQPMRDIEGGSDILKAGTTVVYSSVPGEKKVVLKTNDALATEIPLIGYLMDTDLSQTSYRWLRIPANGHGVFYLWGETKTGANLSSNQTFHVKATPRYLGL